MRYLLSRLALERAEITQLSNDELLNYIEYYALERAEITQLSNNKSLSTNLTLL